MLGSYVLIGSILLGQAAPAADDALRLEVRRLVRQLDAPQLAERDAAEEKLLGMGPKVLELLPPADDRTSAEVLQRLERIRQRLYRNLAEAAAQVSRVTLRGDAMELSKILAALEEQTGNKIIDDRAHGGARGADPELKVDFDKTPFWQALDHVLEQANLTFYPYGEEKAIRVVPRPEGEDRRASRPSYCGPLRIEAVHVTAKRDLRSAKEGALMLGVQIAWEPRLAPISFLVSMADVSALDDQGNSLAIATRDAQLEVPVESDRMAKELIIPLALPPRSVKEIATLKGSFTALVPGKVETLRFKDLAKIKQQEQRLPGATVTLDEVRKGAKLWEVRLRLRLDQPGEALQSHRNWIFENEAYLEGADGKRLDYGTYETTRQKKDEVGIAYLFRPKGELSDYTFVYKTAGLVLPMQYTYELHHLKLP